MKKRLVVGRIIKGVLVNAGGYVDDKVTGTEGIKEIMSPVVEKSVDVVVPTADYPIWEDPDSLAMLSIIRSNHARNMGVR